MSYRLIPLALLLTGCATPEAIKVPYPVPVSEACFLPCLFQGPQAITTNGDLLESYRGKMDQVACLESRLQCVRDGQQSAAVEFGK